MLQVGGHFLSRAPLVCGAQRELMQGKPGYCLWRVIFSSDHPSNPVRPLRHPAASEVTECEYFTPSLSDAQCLMTDFAALF